jgi:hypothetical protein
LYFGVVTISQSSSKGVLLKCSNDGTLTGGWSDSSIIHKLHLPFFISYSFWAVSGVNGSVYSSSNFAIVVTQFVDGKIQVIFAEEYERPNFQAMINRIWEIKQKCGYISNIYVDAANPEVWESLKREFEERYDNQYIRDTIAECKKFNTHIEDRMIVVPVPFSVEGAKMLQHAKWLLEETDEDGSSLVAIRKDEFYKLITGLRTAVANEYKLDKEVTSYDDIVDAFRLSLTFYKRSKE